MSWQRFATDERGVAAVEFAFVLPLLLVLLAGALELRAAWQAARSVNTLAAQAALVIADCKTTNPSGCAGEAQQISNAVGWLAPQLERSRLTIDAAELTRTGGAAKLVSGSQDLANALGPAALARFREGQTGIAIRVTYSHLPTAFASFLGSAFTEKLTFQATAFALKQ